MLDKSKPTKTETTVSAPNFASAAFEITGITPYVMNNMSSAVRQSIITKQESGERTKKGTKRPPKDFDTIYKGTMHISTEGWLGIPASSLRSALISACRLVGFHMTRAKLCVFIEQDGFDAVSGEPLVRIIGEPVRRDMPVKLADGSTDILPRPFFMPWSATVCIKFDADQFALVDVFNLLMRAGGQVGIGAGRPDSKNSTGMGWGTFSVNPNNIKASNG